MKISKLSGALAAALLLSLSCVPAMAKSAEQQPWLIPVKAHVVCSSYIQSQKGLLLDGLSALNVPDADYQQVSKLLFQDVAGVYRSDVVTLIYTEGALNAKVFQNGERHFLSFDLSCTP